MVKPEELLLLRAVLEKSDRDALSFYKDWLRIVGFDKLDGGCFRLLPLLYKRFSEKGQPVPDLNKLKSAYRHALYRNSMLFHKAFEVLAELEKLGVPVVLLKGSALVAAYYEDVGARPMSDVDFLVQEKDVKKTLNLLYALGWKNKEGPPLRGSVRHIHSVDMLNGEGYGLDVHWRAFYQCPWDGADVVLWEQTEKVVFKGATIRILNPAQQILHNCAHGVRWNAVSPTRWIVDVIKILEKKAGFINWESLISEASARKISYTIHYGLSFLKSEFNADIPENVLVKLNEVPKDTREIRFFKVLTSPPSPGNIFTKKWLVHSNSMGNASFWEKAAFFPFFLSKALYQVPPYVRRRMRDKRCP